MNRLTGKLTGKELKFINAAINGKLTVVKSCLKNKADINIMDKENYTALMLASWYGHEKVVEFLIKSGANLDIQNSNGDTALLAAIGSGKLGIVNLLISAGAKLDVQDTFGNTALIYAAYNGRSSSGKAPHCQMIKALIEAKANPLLKDSSGKMATDYMASNKYSMHKKLRVYTREWMFRQKLYNLKSDAEPKIVAISSDVELV